MWKAKKSYSEKLKMGIPKVIFYQHKPLAEIEVSFHRPVEAVSYDRKDILDEKGKVEKIDTNKSYLSVLEI